MTTKDVISFVNNAKLANWSAETDDKQINMHFLFFSTYSKIYFARMYEFVRYM